MKQNNTKKIINYPLSAIRGFSLIELILGISLLIVLISISSIFFVNQIQTSIKNQTISEVEQQGVQIINLITQTIRNADTINSPILGNNANSLSLNTPDALLNPTIFNLNGDYLTITENANPTINLNSSQTQITNLNFANISKATTPETIKTSFTLTYKNNIGRQEYNYSKTFYASASLRK